ncbi:uncharacterized protein DSM5745_07158 [Aspergillus mulundensis]|uniref:Uncharacterized protein n=1 Tax=Aspergillus mulundensis TaxID=1810919 RepID=A0A3D8RKM1_9EURO|nr:hypothetical protein DSM5745_07158 [Aspergillus mulundensis]RDW74496.1 hypothetical protein DSM5745_07158 [Aspergillus mulundensis]
MSSSLSSSARKVVRITDVRPSYSVHLQPSQLQQQQTEITALCISPTGTTSKRLSYAQLRALPGGPDALIQFQVNPADAPFSSNPTPPLPRAYPMESEGQGSRWSRWSRWFRRWCNT